MEAQKRVLIIGLEPTLVDFSRSPGLDAEKVKAAVTGDQAKLNGMGYDTEICLVDLGETAESVVSRQLSSKAYDCVMIGAGLRVLPEHFPLFEKLVNVVHENAPSAKFCFNTNPADTADAVLRWV